MSETKWIERLCSLFDLAAKWFQQAAIPKQVLGRPFLNDDCIDDFQQPSLVKAALTRLIRCLNRARGG